MGPMRNFMLLTVFLLQLHIVFGSEVCTCVERRPIPYGLVHVTGNIYVSLYGDRFHWYSAYKYCRNMGWNLVKLDTETDIAKLLSNYDDQTAVWIGLTRKTHSSEWLWTDGSTLNTSSAIYKTMKNSSDEPACVYAYKSGTSKYLQSTSCTTEYVYVCQYNVDEPPQKLNSLKRSFHNWRVAFETCQIDGATLSMMKTEDQYLRYLSDDRIVEHFNIWVGLEDIDGDGVLKYIDGTEFTNSSFAKWADNQVINEKSPDRVVYVNVTDSLWYITKETAMDFVASYFCEFDQYCN